MDSSNTAREFNRFLIYPTQLLIVFTNGVGFSFLYFEKLHSNLYLDISSVLLFYFEILLKVALKHQNSKIKSIILF
jgi:hypothetical protein